MSIGPRWSLEGLARLFNVEAKPMLAWSAVATSRRRLAATVLQCLNGNLHNHHRTRPKRPAHTVTASEGQTLATTTPLLTGARYWQQLGQRRDHHDPVQTRTRTQSRDRDPVTGLGLREDRGHLTSARAGW